MWHWFLLRIILINLIIFYSYITLYFWSKNKILKWISVNIIVGIVVLITIHISVRDKIYIIENYNPKWYSTTIVKDRNNIIIGKIGHEWRDYISFKDIPVKIIKTLIVTEDIDFYNNIGIDPLGVVYRVMKFFIGIQESIRGTSTITQQMVRNVFLSHERSLLRKLKEVYLTFYVNKYFQKWQILEVYFNYNAFGKNVYGINMAAQYYFDKTLKELKNEEIAFLIGVVQGPSFYDSHLTEALVRKNYVLFKMHQHHLINDEEYEYAKKEVLNFKKFQKTTYSEYILEEVKEILQNNECDINEGLVVETTIDDKLQKIAKDSLKDTVNEWKKSNSQDIKINGVVLIVDPKTGAILASVGGTGFDNSFVDGSRNILRSPGSIMKIFTLLTALENGYELDNKLYSKCLVFDNKTKDVIYINYQEDLKEYEDNENYKIIKNYPNKYYEYVELQDMLNHGFNTTAFYITYLLQEQFRNNLIKFGLITHQQPCYLSMCLGSIFLPIRTIVKCFIPFANGGYKIKELFLLKRIIKNQQVIHSYVIDDNKERLIQEDILQKISFILRRVMTFGSGKRLKHFKLMGKTGTGQNSREGALICWNENMDYMIYVSIYSENYQEIEGLLGATLPLSVTKKILENIEKYHLFTKNDENN